MVAILVYFLAVLLLAGLGFIAIINFWRYRLPGDRTGLVVALFIVAFFLIIVSTLILLNPAGIPSEVDAPTDFVDVF
jgi:hypothetical protein